MTTSMAFCLLQEMEDNRGDMQDKPTAAISFVQRSANGWLQTVCFRYNNKIHFSDGFPQKVKFHIDRSLITLHTRSFPEQKQQGLVIRH